MSSNQDTAHPAKPAPAVAASRRRPALIAVAGVTLLAGLGYGAWWAFALRHHESTDNAYVQAPVVQITPQVGGTVLAVLADDTDIVKAGQPLVRWIRADAQAGARPRRGAAGADGARGAHAVRQQRMTQARQHPLPARPRWRGCRADVARATDDVARRQPLLATGAVSGEEMKHAETDAVRREARAGRRAVGAGRGARAGAEPARR
jgi:membrane fusion protein (multidrug efflux system)